MNQASILFLKILRKLYAKTFGGYQLPPFQREEDPNKASEMIYNLLISDKPCMIARFGAFELATIVNYLGVQNPHHSILKFIKGEQPEWWWNERLIKYMNTNAGFFPPTHEAITQFCELMMQDMKELDLLGSWITNEIYFIKKIPVKSFVQLEILNPFWSEKPWTRALSEKKVLVIHPFAKTINKQYAKREKLFSNPKILPKFELTTIQAVQSLGGTNQFNDWFEALEWMKNEMNKIDYDICLIGCGAYGFPLAAFAKRQGKKAVHLGGALQLLFGIRGARWENPNYNQKYNYSALMNEYWIKPDNNEKPDNAANVEGCCYW